MFLELSQGPYGSSLGLPAERAEPQSAQAALALVRAKEGALEMIRVSGIFLKPFFFSARFLKRKKGSPKLASLVLQVSLNLLIVYLDFRKRFYCAYSTT